jgi:prophage maintenance system killer protein
VQADLIETYGGSHDIRDPRIGLAALVDFLGLNGWRLMVREQEQVAMVLGVAASEYSRSRLLGLGGAQYLAAGIVRIPNSDSTGRY